MTTTPNDAAVNAESAAKLVTEEMLRVAIETYDPLTWRIASGETTSDIKHRMRRALEAVAATLIERHATPQTDVAADEDISELAIKSRDGMKALKAHCKQMDQDRAEALAAFDKKVVAYGCAEEAKGGRCCPDWCMSDSCPVTFEDSPATPQTQHGDRWKVSATFPSRQEAIDFIEDNETEEEFTLEPSSTHGEGEATLGCPKCGYSMTPIFVSDDYMDAPSPTAAPALGELAKKLRYIQQCVSMPGEEWHATLDEAVATLSGVAAGITCPCCEYLVKELREIRDGRLTETQMRVKAAVALNLRPSCGVAGQ